MFVLWVFAGKAVAQEATAPAETFDGVEGDDPLSPYRVRFDVLVDRTIGTASKPVAFNWRRTRAHVAATGGFLVELNTFNSARVGAMARIPSERTLVELGLSWAESWNSSSSKLLALTPYRQAGRPDRLELDISVALPLAEGVVTSAPRFFPAVQLVFNGYAGVRYSVYPAGWGGMTPGQVVGAVFNPGLTEVEVANLQSARLDAMEVDPQRYGLMAGFGNDIYLEQGVFLSPRLMFALPVLAPATGSRLLMQVDLSFVMGVAF